MSPHQPYDDDVHGVYGQAAAERLFYTFSVGQRRQAGGAAVDLQMSRVGADKPDSSPVVSDMSVCSAAGPSLAAFRSSLVPYFTELVNTEEEHLSDMVHPYLSSHMEMKQWEPTGIVMTDLLVSIGDGEAEPRHVKALLVAEGQLVRCIVQVTDSCTRLCLVALWCWVVAKMGLEADAARVMAEAHVVGSHMSSQDDKPMRLEEYFFRSYEFSQELNHKWAVLLKFVFGARSSYRGTVKDTVVCQYHPPFSCPLYVAGAEAVTEETRWAGKVSDELIASDFFNRKGRA